MTVRPLILLVASLSLGACASLQPTGPASSGAAQTGAAQDDPTVLAVRALDRAAQLSGQERLDALETAAWAATQANNNELLSQAIELYPDALLSVERKAAFDTYVALLATRSGDAPGALEILSGAAKPERPRVLGDYWLAQALTYQQLDDGEAATLMLVRRGPQLSAEDRELNNERIWMLQLETSRFLFEDGGSRYDATTQGWLELGRLARQFWTDEADLEAAMNQWQSRFPGHPASTIYWPQARDIALQTLRSAVRNVALLLPTSGRLSGAGQAVRDGFLAAYFGADAAQLTIRIHDTGDNAVAAYEQAVAAGAELIVGPLDKAQVEAVIARNAGRLPILALNYLNQPAAAPGVLEFGLAPEDDAASVARLAAADSHTRAIALVSDDDWGERSLQAFSAAFAESGGQLLDSGIFRGGPRDYPDTIKSLLRLEDSRARAASLQRLIGEELDAQPTRRQDADFLFLAANPSQGRQLRPQFKFYFAADLPIYASDRIYAGSPNPGLDKDLDGVRFCTLPWLLDSSETWRSRRQAIAGAWPQQAERYARLYALGNDAYLLASGLRNANWTQLPPIAGATGELMVKDQRIERHLPCARFVGGQPVSHAPAADRG